MRCAAILIAIFSSAALQESASPSVPLFSGDSLRGWVVEHAPRDGVTARDGSLLVRGPKAWVHTDRAKFKNFKLHFDISSPLPAPQAFLAFLGESPAGERAGTALAVPLLGGAVPTAGAIDHLRLRALVASRSAVSAALRPGQEWQSYDLMRRGSQVTVMLNGNLILDDRAPTLLDGWIGFGVVDGDIALQNIAVAEVAAPAILPGGIHLPGPGVNLPQVVKEGKPNYTRDALRAKVQGIALIECVVGTDGGVSDIQLIRSLDDRFGLDQEAIKAASQWRFKPATVDGRPVPMMVTIELTFTLRR